MMNTPDSDNTLIWFTVTMVGNFSTVGDSHRLTCSGVGHLIVQRASHASGMLKVMQAQRC